MQQGFSAIESVLVSDEQVFMRQGLELPHNEWKCYLFAADKPKSEEKNRLTISYSSLIQPYCCLANMSSCDISYSLKEKRKKKSNIYNLHIHIPTCNINNPISLTWS